MVHICVICRNNTKHAPSIINTKNNITLITNKVKNVLHTRFNIFEKWILYQSILVPYSMEILYTLKGINRKFNTEIHQNNAILRG